MKIPADTIVPEEKITRYLLVYKARNDKSKFLERAGFSWQNSEALRIAIFSLSQSGEAVADRNNEYGTFYRVDGELISRS